MRSSIIVSLHIKLVDEYNRKCEIKQFDSEKIYKNIESAIIESGLLTNGKIHYYNYGV